jgi:penicillin-insensitive murein endopeptidase
MRCWLSTGLAGLAFAFAAQAAERTNIWSLVETPTPAPAKAIGGTANGCLAGGVRLPADGPGYEVIRLTRHRYFGHGDMVDFVEGLGKRAQAAGLPLFYVGDMAQPRGGPLPFGHASHQTGIDVDIWFTAATKPGLSEAAREEPPLPSMIIPGDTPRLDPTQFGRGQVVLLRLAADDPRVDRIFVNPVIKLAMCRGFGDATVGGSAWLQRLRPWWGHDDHFHVRLRCPDNSPDCEPQKPIPEGDGCDASVEDWTHHLTPPKPPAGPRMPKIMPAACQALVKQGSG